VGRWGWFIWVVREGMDSLLVTYELLNSVTDMSARRVVFGGAYGAASKAD
jgi:hypothetical protein